MEQGFYIDTREREKPSRGGLEVEAWTDNRPNIKNVKIYANYQLLAVVF